MAADKKPADKKPADKKPADKKPADKKPADKKPAPSESFTKEERAAMRARAKELKAAQDAQAQAKAVEDAIAALPEADRLIAAALDRIVRSAAPALTPKTFYGMPGYAKDGKVLVFFQSSDKFKTRSTIGFQDNATLDAGTMWPASYAITKITAANEKAITALVKKAAG